MKIVTEPDKLLHQKSKKIRTVTKEIRELALKMQEIKELGKGVGLSAVQIGKPIRLIVVGYTPKNQDDEKCRDTMDEEVPFLELINPKITNFSRETEILDEGCLSVPGIEIPIRRSLSVNVLAQDLDGHRLKIRAKGLLARVLQHEIDHLDGIIITDRVEKKILKKYLEKKKNAK